MSVKMCALHNTKWTVMCPEIEHHQTHEIQFNYEQA